MFPFTYAASVHLAVGTSSGNVALNSPSGGNTVRLSTPAGTDECFIAFGSSTVTAAAATAVHFPAGTIEVVTIPAGTTHVAAICASGSTTLYAVRSNGG